MEDERHLLARRRHCQIGSAAATHLSHERLLIVIGSDSHLYLRGSSTLLDRPQLAVVAVAERTVRCHRQRTYRMLRMVGDALHLRRARSGLVNIERTAVALAQEIVRPSVGSPYSITILTGRRCEFFESRTSVVVGKPYIAGDRRCVMLAQGILIALLIGIEYAAIHRIDRNLLHGKRSVHLRTPALDTHLVGLRKKRRRKLYVGLSRHDRRAEQQCIGSEESNRSLSRRMRSELHWLSSRSRYDEYIHRTVAIARKSYRPSVGTPHRSCIVCGIGRDLTSLSAAGTDGEYITAICKRDSPAIRRNSRIAQPQRRL